MNDLGSVDPRELCLVPDLVMPPKFKMPKFEKYDGTKCPENHLATYCNKMAGHAHNEDLLIHVFYDSLTGTNTADPITIPDLDDPKEQEKIQKESSE